MLLIGKGIHSLVLSPASDPPIRHGTAARQLTKMLPERGRINSPSNLIEYKNKGPEGEFNPSFPEFGKLLAEGNLPSALETNAALRIGTGQFEYCAGCSNYGNDLLNLVKGAVKSDILQYLNSEVKMRNNRLIILRQESKNNLAETLRTQVGINQYTNYINNIQNVK